MFGGLMQLVAYGAQDLYLTGDPKISFFKATYKPHDDVIKTLLKQNTTESMYKLAQYYENQKDYDNMLKYYLVYVNNINIDELEELMIMCTDKKDIYQFNRLYDKCYGIVRELMNDDITIHVTI